MGIDFDSIKRLKELGIKHVSLDPDSGSIEHIEFFPTTPQVQAVNSLPPLTDMPPDDVMMFAATEDVDELMKQRKPE